VVVKNQSLEKNLRATEEDQILEELTRVLR